MAHLHTFSVLSMVRGFHVYKSIWEANCDEVLRCEREVGNPLDPSAVAVKKGTTIVGHVPRKISTICSIFIRQGGTISCMVNGSRRYSSDLPQGGLEVPCILTFSTPQVYKSEKTKKLVESALALSVELTLSATKYSGNEKIVSSSSGEVHSTNTRHRASLVHTDVIESDDEFKPLAKKQKLDDSEIENIIMGVELSDIHINLAQRFLKHQFPGLNGLESTLFQDKEHTLTEDNVKNKLQIIHCKQRHHWIVASTVNGRYEEVVIIDSLFRAIDEETKQIIFNLFQFDCKKPPTIKVIKTQKQKGNKDCGLFAIAMATAIAFGNNPSKQNFCQELMRAHLVDCLKKGQLSLFP